MDKNVYVGDGQKHVDRRSWIIAVVAVIGVVIIALVVLWLTLGEKGLPLFEKKFTLTISQTGVGSYTLSPLPDDKGKYKMGTIVKVLASPAPGWELVTPISPVMMDDDKKLAIIFKLKPVVKTFSFKVNSRSRYPVDVIPPWDNARVEGNMSSDLDINFRVQDPAGNNINVWDRVTRTSFSFTTTSRGTYKLIFDNSFSLTTAKNVNLSFTVYPP